MGGEMEPRASRQGRFYDSSVPVGDDVSTDYDFAAILSPRALPNPRTTPKSLRSLVQFESRVMSNTFCLSMVITAVSKLFNEIDILQQSC